MKVMKLVMCAIMLAALASCAIKDEPFYPDQDEQTGLQQAELCSESVTAILSDPASRAISTTTDIDRFTATRVDSKPKTYSLVSYHGRNRENIGMVQIVSKQDYSVLSEIVFPDARVNFAQLRETLNGKKCAYIAVDRTGNNDILCGLVCVPIENDRFVLSEQTTQITPYKVDGISVNCIKQHNGDTQAIGNSTLVVAAGGNNALGMDMPAGFTKFKINQDDPTKLYIISKHTGTNYRGYWFSFGYLNHAPAAYTYRTVEGNDLVFGLGVISYSDAVDMFANNANTKFIQDYPGATTEVYRQKDNTENYGRYCVIAIYKDKDAANKDKFIITSTGSKDGGVRCYRYDQGEQKLTLVDVWHKACTCLGTEVITRDVLNGEQWFIFAGCGDGVYKLRVDFDYSDPGNKKIKLIPVEKRRTETMTESGTLSSTNYIQTEGAGSNSKLHVAGGYEGYYIIPFNGPDWIPADPRED